MWSCRYLLWKPHQLFKGVIQAIHIKDLCLPDQFQLTHLMKNRCGRVWKKTNLYLHNNFPVTEHWKLEHRYLFIHTPQSAAGKWYCEQLHGAFLIVVTEGFCLVRIVWSCCLKSAIIRLNVVWFTKPKNIQCVLFQGLLVISVLGFLIITNSKCIPKLKWLYTRPCRRSR